MVRATAHWCICACLLFLTQSGACEMEGEGVAPGANFKRSCFFGLFYVFLGPPKIVSLSRDSLLVLVVLALLYHVLALCVVCFQRALDQRQLCLNRGPFASADLVCFRSVEERRAGRSFDGHPSDSTRRRQRLRPYAAESHLSDGAVHSAGPAASGARSSRSFNEAAPFARETTQFPFVCKRFAPVPSLGFRKRIIVWRY